MAPALTIGMATYRDFDGVYFTLQALRLYQDLEGVELLVIDNHGCDATRDLVTGWVGEGRYVRDLSVTGTAAPRDRVFAEARGEGVLCLDCHVLLVPGAVARLKRYYRDHPGTGDLLQGPLVYDDLTTLASHFDPVWRGGMWGVWAVDDRAEDPEGEPFDIPMQGLGLFSCRRETWPGFHRHFRGFGGEEGYLHQKVRARGGRCLCLPWLRWVHRFGRPAGVPYPLNLRDRVINYLLGHRELGLDEGPVLEHFADQLDADSLREARAEVDRLAPRPTAPRLHRASGVRDDVLVSCLMPTFNRLPHNREMVEEAIECFLRQDHPAPARELLILNDTPGQTLECPAPGVRVFNLGTRLPDLGAKVAFLIEEARGDLFCRWDDDDISLPWRISLSLDRLGEGLYWRPDNHWLDDGVLQLPSRAGYCHIAGIFRRAILPRIGGYPSGYGPKEAEDALFHGAVARLGLDRADTLAPEDHFYIYRWNNGSVHLSGGESVGEGWRQRGAEPVVGGTFTLEPRWHRDHLRAVRHALTAGPPVAWDTIGGDCEFEALYLDALNRLPSDAVFVEVGCRLGRGITLLARAARKARRRLRLYAVDDGSGSDGTPLSVEQLRANLLAAGVGHAVRLLVMESAAAATLFLPGSVDFVFLDGAHDRDSVRTGLQAWWPRIRPGGWLAGHGYTSNHPGVVQAVDGYFGVAPGALRSPVVASCWERRRE